MTRKSARYAKASIALPTGTLLLTDTTTPASADTFAVLDGGEERLGAAGVFRVADGNAANNATNNAVRHSSCKAIFVLQTRLLIWQLNTQGYL